MLKKQSNKKNQGFTIIEVMIVLAIAGLILLVVFLAVPALQRSARNTSRKTDVQAILASISSYEDNNDGLLPTGLWLTAGNPTTVNFGNANTLAANTATTDQSNLGYYTAAAGTTNADTKAGDIYLNVAPGAAVAAVASGTDYVEIVTQEICNGNAGASVGASERSFIALYNVETGSGSWGPQCQQS